MSSLRVDDLGRNLARVVPRGSVVMAFFPKDVLGSVLPGILMRKNCKVICIGGSKDAIRALSSFSVNKEDVEHVDVVLAEPVVFTEDGAYFDPNEAAIIDRSDLIGVGFERLTDENPSYLDFVGVKKSVTEKGIFNSVNGRI